MKEFAKHIAALVTGNVAVYLCGNGGSAANAIHIANDWQMVGVRAFALTADVATLTRIANDESYKEVFYRQVLTVGRSGDVLIALSGSGKSQNVRLGMRAAKRKGMLVFSLVGAYPKHAQPIYDGAHRALAIGSDMQDAEEQQLRFGHEVMRIINRRKK